jgi:2'-5' RNA ligase
MKVFTIASVLDPAQSGWNHEDWQFFDRLRFGHSFSTNGDLHFSWHVAGEYNTEKVLPLLQKMASELPPYEITTTGIGIFTGPRPVLYLPVIKTKWMADLHTALWDALESHASQVSDYYCPNKWMPHITLIYEETDIEKVLRIAGLIMKTPLKLELNLNHFAMIYRDDRDHGLLWKIPFGEKS